MLSKSGNTLTPSFPFQETEHTTIVFPSRATSILPLNHSCTWPRIKYSIRSSDRGFVSYRELKCVSTSFFAPTVEAKFPTISASECFQSWALAFILFQRSTFFGSCSALCWTCLQL